MVPCRQGPAPPPERGDARLVAGTWCVGCLIVGWEGARWPGLQVPRCCELRATAAGAASATASAGGERSRGEILEGEALFAPCLVYKIDIFRNECLVLASWVGWLYFPRQLKSLQSPPPTPTPTPTPHHRALPLPTPRQDNNTKPKPGPPPLLSEANSRLPFYYCALYCVVYSSA